jgi:hypothetical protein
MRVLLGVLLFKTLQIKNPAIKAGYSSRGGGIRTHDLTDPNGARYQTAPRPELRVNYTGKAYDWQV